jgi:pimeloyl-ACP methyl ester carboxylesterase
VRIRLPSGVDLHYIESGAGAPLVFLHGGMGDYEFWEAQVGEFSGSHRAISYSRRYSHPNCNEPVAADHSALIEADDLAAFLDRLDVERAHLVGTSYGALTALVFALRQPGRLAGLILAEPPVHRWAIGVLGGDVLYSRFLSQVWNPAGAAFRSGAPERAMKILADGMWGKPVFERLCAARRSAIMRNARAMQALVQSSNPFPVIPREAVSRLELPVLLIAGEHAIELHRLVNQELAHVLPNARQITVPGASHGSPRENAGYFNAIVREALHAPSSRGR